MVKVPEIRKDKNTDINHFQMPQCAYFFTSNEVQCHHENYDTVRWEFTRPLTYSYTSEDENTIRKFLAYFTNVFPRSKGADSDCVILDTFEDAAKREKIDFTKALANLNDKS